VSPVINAPHKTLATRSGLARYGRNNITYIDRLGSFYRLTTVHVDVPCQEVAWSEPAVMSACEGCALCTDACPTEAISDGRFLLRAERCITWWNEKPGDVPFPEWVPVRAHHAVVGCMRCQLVCPENGRVLRGSERGPSFSEDETRTLLQARRPGELPQELRLRLIAWDMLPMLDTLPRNLAACLKAQRTLRDGGRPERLRGGAQGGT
jgi:epoxyqueuosine reductase